MTNLSCGVTSCANYQNNLCTLPSIQVDGKRAQNPGQTCCSSFEEQGQGATNEADAGSASPETEVRCKATTCVFNGEGVCRADTITVAGAGAQSHEQTECSSFERE